MVRKVRLPPAARTQAWIGHLTAEIKQAHKQLRRGDAAGAAERARAASFIAKAIKDAHALPEIAAPRTPEQDARETRADFLRRLAGYMEPARAAELLAALNAERPEEGDTVGDVGR